MVGVSMSISGEAVKQVASSWLGQIPKGARHARYSSIISSVDEWLWSARDPEDRDRLDKYLSRDLSFACVDGISPRGLILLNRFMVSQVEDHANAFLAEARRDVSFWWWWHRFLWSARWGCAALHTDAVRFTRIDRLRAMAVSGVPTVHDSRSATDDR